MEHIELVNQSRKRPRARCRASRLSRVRSIPRMFVIQMPFTGLDEFFLYAFHPEPVVLSYGRMPFPCAQVNDIRVGVNISFVLVPRSFNS